MGPGTSAPLSQTSSAPLNGGAKKEKKEIEKEKEEKPLVNKQASHYADKVGGGGKRRGREGVCLTFIYY